MCNAFAAAAARFAAAAGLEPVTNLSMTDVPAVADAPPPPPPRLSAAAVEVAVVAWDAMVYPAVNGSVWHHADGSKSLVLCKLKSR